jgi:arabinoxylan arabinofuranohydrolase
MKREIRNTTTAVFGFAPVFLRLALVTIVSLFGPFSARADYPIVSQRYAADPTGIEFNGRLYLYCSNDDDNGTNGYVMHSLTCFSTDDLKNWTDHGIVFQVPQNASWASLSWAPSVISNKGTLYLYFANGASGIGVATSSIPSGPFVDARGSALVTGSTPGASTPTQWLFDPCAFIDDNGTPYLYFGGQYPTNARVILLNANLTSVSGSALPMFATNFFEASYMHKRNGIYYYTYCDRFEVGAAIYCETNSNPTNGFVPQGTVLPNPPQNVNNNNHHSIFSYLGNWYIAYHNRAAALANGLSNGDAVYKRSVCLDRVNYNPDGSIQQVTATTDGLPQLKNLNPFVRVEAETIAQQNGIKTEVCTEGALDVTSITNGSWIRVRGVNFGSGASTFFARIASGGSGGNIELHLDNLAGTLIGTCAVSSTGGWQNWTTVPCNVSGASGVHDIFLKFTGGTGNLFNVNWWQFQPGANSTSSFTVSPGTTFQTIEGLGGATAFYAGWIKDHPFKQEIYSNAFAGLNLSMLRLGNWFRYTNGPDTAAFDIVANANRVLGHPVPILISSWAPPAFLKSNGQVGNGGTLAMTNGVFAYTNFAQYWYDSILSYQANGVTPTWVSIQNEPDWAAGYDSCIFHPNEDTVNGTNYASYSKALDAVYQRLTNLPAPPKILAPECVHIAFNDLKNYAATMNSNSFYGVTAHLYGDSTDGTPDGFKGNMSAAATFFPSKPHFMTEYGITGVTNMSPMIEAAWLMHNALTVEQVSGYNFWNLVWPNDRSSLVQIENPYDSSRASWTNAPPGTPTQSHGWWLSPCYWSMKHFSYFIQPGFKRVSATCTDAKILTSAYLSPDGLRLVVVLINTSTNSTSAATANFGTFSYFMSAVFQSTAGNYFQPLGAVGSQIILPPASLTTIVLDKFVAVGDASNPSPTNTQSSVALGATLNWSPGSNALSHAVYIGVYSNAVALATTVSPVFQGIISTNSFAPVNLGGITTYFWRVDEIAGANTNTGAIWSFTTLPAPALAHRYSFSETSGTIVSDSIGGPLWAGTLPAGGTFSSGQLTLASASQQYVSLPPAIVSTLSNCTIETWVRLNSTASWSRIFDFGSNTTTNMFLTPQNGSTTKLRFAITTGGAGGEQRIDGTSALSVGPMYHIAVTLAGNTGILYLNGVPVGTNSSITLKPSSLGNTSNNYLGKSQYADPYLNGMFDEFRIYTVPLSFVEIAATDALGPNQLLSTNSPSITVASTGTNLTLTWPLASAGFTLQSRTNLVFGNWANVASPAPQIIDGHWQVALPQLGGVDSTFYRLSK